MRCDMHPCTCGRPHDLFALSAATTISSQGTARTSRSAFAARLLFVLLLAAASPTNGQLSRTSTSASPVLRSETRGDKQGEPRATLTTNSRLANDKAVQLRSAPEDAEDPIYAAIRNYIRSWYHYFVAEVDETLDEAVDDMQRAVHRFIFSGVFGERVGWARTKRMSLQLLRMALGVWLALYGGSAKLKKPVLVVLASQLASFTVTTVRTIAGLPRVPLVLRELLVLSMAAVGLHVPMSSDAVGVAACSLGLHMGKSVRGVVRATYREKEQNENWGRKAAEFADEVMDDVSDSIASALGAKEWWDDEPTMAEAEQARWRWAGRLLSSSIATLATASVILQPQVFQGASAWSVAAAVSGAFMFERNLHNVLEENWLHIRVFVARWAWKLLRFAVWAWRSGFVRPLRWVLKAVREVERRLERAIHLVASTVFPPLKRISADELGEFLKKIPFSAGRITKRLATDLLRLLGILVSPGVRSFALDVLERSERFLLPYGFAALGLAKQMGVIQLKDLPGLCMALLNPQQVLVKGLQPLVVTVMVQLRMAARHMFYAGKSAAA